LKDRILCEDVITETFISIWSKVDQYDHRYNFSTWAYAIAKNNCWGVLKEKKKTVSIDKVPFKSLHSKNFMYVNRITTTDIECLAPSGDELIQKLYDVSINAIYELKEPYKTVMIEREINKKQLDAIADDLGWNLSTVKTRLRKAKVDIADKVKLKHSHLVESYLYPEDE
jgi:RNA polymerase sigma-70 factor (ECF subfamily)